MLILAVILVFIVLGYNTCNRVFDKDKAEVPDYIQVAPVAQTAPYVLQTDSRVYYIVKYTDDGKVITLTDYYTYDKKKWEHQTKTLLIDRQYYAYINLQKRGQE